MENKYLIKFCDRETGQLLIPFGHIDDIVMPSVKQCYQQFIHWVLKAQCIYRKKLK